VTGRRILIEAAIESPDDARAAEAGGADRLELCAALDLGGLTPSLGAFQEVAACSRLPVVVMIRPRPGDFVYSDADVRVMLRDVEAFRPLNPAGFVFGCLAADGRVHTDHSRRLVSAGGGAACVFHRAFDRAPDPMAALDTLGELGFARVLTSGGADTATAGSVNIAAAVKRAGPRLTVLPCGRVRADSAVTVVQATGCTQVHGSFAEAVPVGRDRGVRGYPSRSRTSQDEVAACREALDRYALGR
jgi:copper homeostasis protein